MALATTNEVGEHHHVVQFYEHDDELAAGVAEYVDDAVHADDTVIVVATPPHLRSFRSALGARGVDVAAITTSGHVHEVDTRAALSMFMIGDRPDPESFTAGIGGLIRRAAGSGRRVRVYGEMVALLWDAGHVAAAIALEELWNELGREIPFALYCAYPAGSFAGEAGVDDRRAVCALHSSVIGHPHDAASGDSGGDAAGGDAASGDAASVGTASVGTASTGTARAAQVDDLAGHAGVRSSAPAHASRTFRCEPRAATATRHFVAGFLRSVGCAQLVDDVSIVVTELATNALVHARSDFVATVSVPGEAIVHVSIRDSSPALPAVGNPVASSLSGRGLLLVDTIATRWGTELVDDGKLVWAEFGA